MSTKEPYTIKTEEDFNRVMEIIDKEMREENLPIPARQMKGWVKFSARFGLGLKMHDPLAQKIMDWFDSRYGDKLNVDYAIGELAVMIRGDLYKMRIPTMYGQVRIIYDPHAWRHDKRTQIAKDKNDPLPVVNVLNCIEGLTEAYALTLSPKESYELFRLFMFALEAARAIGKASRVDFVDEAKGDIEASITYLFAERPQYGFSKWASLQATEKFLKAFITKQGGRPRFTHKLQELANLAASHGLSATVAADLKKIQCLGSVRYGEIPVSGLEALEAHHETMKVCSQIAKLL